MTANLIAAVALLIGADVAAAPPAPFRDCADCPLMRMIPAGSFEMGSTNAETERDGVPPATAAREQPRHRVTLARPFAISVYEITVREYAAFAVSGAAVAPGCIAAYDRATDSWKAHPDRSWRDPGFLQSPDHPVLCVSWNDAVALTEWLSTRAARRYRLPTEAEWEYAARGGTTTARYWGDGREGACDFASVGDQAGARHYGWPMGADRIFACDDTFAHSAPVGRFQPNAFGLHDMLGNAWEWVADCFHDGYAGAGSAAPDNGAAWVDGLCDRRVERGGGWSGRPNLLRAAARGGTPPDNRSRHIGIRVARDSDRERK